MITADYGDYAAGWGRDYEGGGGGEGEEGEEGTRELARGCTRRGGGTQFEQGDWGLIAI